MLDLLHLMLSRTRDEDGYLRPTNRELKQVQKNFEN